VGEVLQEKHPKNCPVAAEVILPSSSQSVNTSIILEEIDAALIQKMALKCTDAHGPSASEWKQLCSSFGTASNDLFLLLLFADCVFLILILVVYLPL